MEKCSDDWMLWLFFRVEGMWILFTNVYFLSYAAYHNEEFVKAYNKKLEALLGGSHHDPVCIM